MSPVGQAKLTPAAPRTTLWTLCQHNRRLTAEVVWGDRHWELRLFAQGVLFLLHPCETREGAVAYADLIQRDFAQDGWHSRVTADG